MVSNYKFITQTHTHWEKPQKIKCRYCCYRHRHHHRHCKALARRNLHIEFYLTPHRKKNERIAFLTLKMKIEKMHKQSIVLLTVNIEQWNDHFAKSNVKAHTKPLDAKKIFLELGIERQREKDKGTLVITIIIFIIIIIQ